MTKDTGRIDVITRVVCEGYDFEGQPVLEGAGVSVRIGILKLSKESDVRVRVEECMFGREESGSRCFVMSQTCDPERKGVYCRLSFDYLYSKKQNPGWKPPGEIIPVLQKLGIIEPEEDADENVFDYTASEVPEWYRCLECEQTGMQLWESDNLELSCKACIMKVKLLTHEDVEENPRGVDIPYIKPYLPESRWDPAIPSAQATSNHGTARNEQITKEMLDWWKRLPVESSHPQELFFQ